MPTGFRIVAPIVARPFMGVIGMPRRSLVGKIMKESYEQIAAKIPELHSCYCSLSGSPLPLTAQAAYAWERWACKFNIEQLRMVLGSIKEGIKKRRRRIESMRFRNLIENYDKFAEELAFLKMEQNAARRPVPKVNAGLAGVLRATDRPTRPESKPARAIAEVIEKVMTPEAFSKALREWKEANL